MLLKSVHILYSRQLKDEPKKKKKHGEAMKGQGKKELLLERDEEKNMRVSESKRGENPN